jgi:hypothetical protein
MATKAICTCNDTYRLLIDRAQAPDMALQTADRTACCTEVALCRGSNRTEYHRNNLEETENVTHMNQSVSCLSDILWVTMQPHQGEAKVPTALGW